jgi:hypothetical protein
MKQYDLVVGFGCSFLDGGGLDNPQIYKKLNKVDSILGLGNSTEFKHKNNFISYLAKLLNSEYTKVATAGSSNELIFENIFNYFNNKKIDKKILMVGQISIFSRIHVYYEKTKEFKKLNQLDFNSPPFNGQDKYKELYQYYETYLKYIYNSDVVYNKIVRDITIYTNWLESMGIDCIWLSYDGESKHFLETKNFIKFNGNNLSEWLENNKLRLCDITELETDDLHISIQGHKEIAERIYTHLKNNL